MEQIKKLESKKKLLTQQEILVGLYELLSNYLNKLRVGEELPNISKRIPPDQTFTDPILKKMKSIIKCMDYYIRAAQTPQGGGGRKRRNTKRKGNRHRINSKKKRNKQTNKQRYTKATLNINTKKK